MPASKQENNSNKASEFQLIEKLKHKVEERTRQFNEINDRYRNLVENAPIGIVEIVFEGQLISVNPAFASMLGACQAMPDNAGEPSNTESELNVSTRQVEKRVEIVFEDSGVGIPEEHISHVLEPLYSTKSFGTGLGLPTVQRIMEEHGGGIAIDSELGRGTRVTLWLSCGSD